MQYTLANCNMQQNLEKRGPLHMWRGGDGELAVGSSPRGSSSSVSPRCRHIADSRAQDDIDGGSEVVEADAPLERSHGSRHPESYAPGTAGVAFPIPPCTRMLSLLMATIFLRTWLPPREPAPSRELELPCGAPTTTWGSHVCGGTFFLGKCVRVET